MQSEFRSFVIEDQIVGYIHSNWQIGSLYILISGATDGSIAFWDLTKSIEAFMQLVSVLDVEKFIDCQKRLRTWRIDKVLVPPLLKLEWEPMKSQNILGMELHQC